MIEKLEKLTVAHFLYVMAAGAAAGFLFILLDKYVISPLEPKLGIPSAGAAL